MQSFRGRRAKPDVVGPPNLEAGNFRSGAYLLVFVRIVSGSALHGSVVTTMSATRHHAMFIPKYINRVTSMVSLPLKHCSSLWFSKDKILD